MPNIRKSAKEKELAGNPGKRPIPKETKTGALAPPKVLSVGARQVWERLVSAMPAGVYQITDQAILAAYCEQVAIHEQAVIALAKPDNPLIVQGSQGQPVVSGWVKILNEAAAKIVTLGARLHLDPVSRQSINTSEAADEDEFAPKQVKH